MDEILERAARSSPDVQPPSLDRVTDAIKSSLRPVRPLPPNWVLTGALILVSASVAVAGAARAGFYGIENLGRVEGAAILSMLGILIWAAAREFACAMIPGSRLPMAPGSLLAMSSGVLLGVFALFFRDYKTDHFFSAGLVCLFIGFVHAVPVGLLAWLLLRRGFAVNAAAAGLAAGTLGGLAGVAMLELHCPNFQATHVLIWHTAVVPFSAAVGALLARTLHLPRSTPSQG